MFATGEINLSCARRLRPDHRGRRDAPNKSMIRRTAVCAVTPVVSKNGFTSTTSSPTTRPFSRQADEQRAHLLEREPPHLDRTGAWRETRVKDIDVQRNVDVPDAGNASSTACIPSRCTRSAVTIRLPSCRASATAQASFAMPRMPICTNVTPGSFATCGTHDAVIEDTRVAVAVRIQMRVEMDDREWGLSDPANRRERRPSDRRRGSPGTHPA